MYETDVTIEERDEGLYRATRLIGRAASEASIPEHVCTVAVEYVCSSAGII